MEIPNDFIVGYFIFFFFNVSNLRDIYTLVDG